MNSEQDKHGLSMIRVFLALTLMALSLGANTLDQELNKVDNLFEEYDKPDSPGCALGIIKDGKFLFTKGYGMANLDYGIPNTPQTVFRIGSTSKQFTAACLAILIEEGKVSLDDPLQKYLPELSDLGEGITIGDLVYHTSGIPDYEALQMLQGELDDQGNHHAGEIMDLLSRQELIFQPKERWDYSNSNYILLAVILERISGKTFAEFAEEHIFNPLGMTHSHIHDDNRKIIKNRAVGYSAKGEAFQVDETITELVGDDGVFTTLEDLLLWDRNFYASKIISPDFPQHLQKVGRLKTGKEHDYAFGLMISSYKGLKTVAHGGAFVGFRAQMLRFPDQRFTIIVLANLGSINPSGLCYKIADILLSDQLKEEPKKPDEDKKRMNPVIISPEQLKTYVGHFEDPESGIVIQIDLEDGDVYLKVLGQKYHLKPKSKNILLADAPIGITIDYSNQSTEKTVIFDVENQGQFKMRPIQTEALSPKQLAEYAGEYYSNQLMTSYAIGISKGILQLRLPKQAKRFPLTPKKRDSFSTPSELNGISIDFQRNVKGEVKSLSVRLPMNRVKTIHFVKK